MARSRIAQVYLTTAVFVLLNNVTGCQIAGPGDGEAELNTLEKRIEDMIGEAPAQSPDACKTIAFGSKPCGGPWRYLVYSSEFTDETELVALVNRYNQAQDRLNRENGLFSDCSIAIRPDVTLNDGFCQTSSGR